MDIAAQHIHIKQASGLLVRTNFFNSLSNYDASKRWDVCFSSYHIMCSCSDGSHHFTILLKNVDLVECSQKEPLLLTLRLKNLLSLEVVTPDKDTTNRIVATITSLSNIDTVTALYPFTYRADFDFIEEGWELFLPETEFIRHTNIGNNWRLSSVNKEFKICPTYPSLCIVPKNVSDDILIRSASFRFDGRFPILAYFHKKNSAVLLRSSQPLISLNNKRCREDELLLNSILGSNFRGYILDTRASDDIKKHQSKGGGSEQESNYSRWRHIPDVISRPSVFHNSFIKLIQATREESSTEKWMSSLNSSGWLTLIKEILTAACVCAQTIDREGACVLVHGCEGIDTTLQVTSLVQLILDSDCRTIKGFEALIEREWLQGGHPFRDRCFKSAFSLPPRNKFVSPTFLLFLDCTWQIWRQFPGSFEFNESFLQCLFEHAYASEYGTFLSNNEKERKELRLMSKTVSLWSYTNCPSVLEKFTNPLYEMNELPVWPSVAPQSFHLWLNLYMRDSIDFTQNEIIWRKMKNAKDENNEAKTKARMLRKQLAALEAEALNKGLIKADAPSP